MTNHWKSKTLIMLLILLFTISIAGCGAPATSTPAKTNVTEDDGTVYQWTMQGFTPEGTLCQNWAHNWAELVETLSRGRIKIDVYPPGSIVPSLEGIYAVRDGVLDVHFGYAGMWIGHELAAPLFCSVPGLMSPQDMVQWLYQGGGIELWQEMADGVNAKVIPTAILGMEGFMWANEPLQSIADFKGKTLRMMPLMGEVLQEYGSSMGIAVEFLPGAEIVPALERGVVDAAEYAIPALDKDFGFHDVAKYYHFPGIHQPCSTCDVMINKNKWDELPEDLQEIVLIASEVSVLRNWTECERKNIEALNYFEEVGVQSASGR